MTEQEIEQQLQDALFTPAIGATVEEIGRDEQGNTKIFKRKLPPNLDAIKYLREIRKTPHRAKRWSPPDLPAPEDTTC